MNQQHHLLLPHIREALHGLVNDLTWGDSLGSFEQSLQNALDALSTAPKEFTLALNIDTDPRNYGPRGKPLLLAAAMLRELAAIATYRRLTNSYRTHEFVEEICRGLNEGQFTTVVAAARMTMESAAILNYHVPRLTEACNDILERKPSSIRHACQSPEGWRCLVEELAKASGEARKQLALTRFDWRGYVTGAPKATPTGGKTEEPKQVRAGKAIEKLSFTRQSRLPTAIEQYGLLCDFVHPNRGADTLFIDRAWQSDGKLYWALKENPRDESCIQAVLEVIGVPVQECLEVIIAKLSTLDQIAAKAKVLSEKLRHYSA